MAHLHCERRTRIQIQNPEAKLYYAEHVHITRLQVVSETQSILVKVLNCVHYLYCRFEIFEVTRKITRNIAFFAPRNANMEQVSYTDKIHFDSVS